MKITIRDNELLSNVFDAAHYAASLWVDPSLRPQLPERYQWKDREPTPVILIYDDKVVYQTVSGKGKYTFTPDEFVYEGYRRSLLDGCLMVTTCLDGPPAPLGEDGLRDSRDTPPVTPANLVRVDICIWAPIGRYGTQMGYFELYDPVCESSKPFEPFEEALEL